MYAENGLILRPNYLHPLARQNTAVLKGVSICCVQKTVYSSTMQLASFPVVVSFLCAYGHCLIKGSRTTQNRRISGHSP